MKRALLRIALFIAAAAVFYYFIFPAISGLTLMM